MSPSQLKHISEYYNQTHKLYRIFWHHDKSYALHYGLWDQETKNRQAALLNENKILATLLNLSGGEKILDAGCGVGGSCLWLAENYDVNIVGITVSDAQVYEAKRLIKEHGLNKRISVEKQDYLNTKFPAGSFDIVWAIESVCHSTEKKDFLKEAFRVLKPGGKIIVADGVLLRGLRKSEEKDYQQFLEGMALPNLANFADFKRAMEETGFRRVRAINKTHEALPSSKEIYRQAAFFYPLAWLTYKLGVIPEILFKNSLAGISQYRVVKSGAAGYGVFYGEK
jgi:tocopherol O-methyltransferase